MNDYKKSYTGLLIMIGLFFIGIFIIPFLPFEDPKILTLLIGNLLYIWLFLLMIVIYITEKIYWFNDISYKDARKACSASRKDYALKRVYIFLKAMVLFMIYSAVSYFIGLHLYVDIAAEIFGIIAVVLATADIKFTI